MKAKTQNLNNKILVFIFAIVFAVLLAGAYLVAIQPNLEYWSLFLCGLAALVFLDMRWLMKATSSGEAQT